jgi:predicted dehydrogenase
MAAPPDLLLVGVGPHAHYKHLPAIQRAVRSGLAAGYSILELESARPRLEALLPTLAVPPKRLALVPDRRAQGVWHSAESDDALAALCAELPSLKVVLATEPKAHFPYLKWCIAHRRDCLVDKPITLPMSPARVIDPSRLAAELAELIDLAREHPGNYSVMTPRRYHRVYEMVRRYAAGYVRALGTPVTYISLYHGEGVWNTPPEYLEREDHPYKYGYGKLLHSGYHYVDVLQRMLDLNAPVVPPEEMEIDFVARAAGPVDQQAQVPEGLYERMEGAPRFAAASGPPFGETDVAAAFSARRRTGGVIALGNLALLQTTTSLRNWGALPTDVYNKTGRFGVEELRLNLGFAASVAARILKVPVAVEGRRIAFREEFEVLVTRNGNLLGGSCLERRSGTVGAEGLLEAGRWRLFTRWLRGEETRSRLDRHLRSVQLLEKILLSTSGQTASNRP